MSSRSVGLLVGLILGIAVLGTLYYTVRPVPVPVAEGKDERDLPPAAAAGNPVLGPPKVKLAVLIVFDQMRGDYVDRWMSLYGAGGVRRLVSDGAHFTQCHYPYGLTSTGPGHASVLSGCSADKHGITNNEWFDRATGSNHYCSGTDRYDLVPGPAKPSVPKKNAGAPVRMLSPTVGDVLKQATGGKAKVFGLSLKDRSAILPVGRKPDGVYWFDGKFVTSTFYRESLPAWVADFNRGKRSEQWFETPWTKFRTDVDYVRHSGPDDVTGEARLTGRGTTFPHSLTGGQKELGKEYFESMYASPFGNDLLLAFAKACVVAEKLGDDDVPDLLTVSFSSNDVVGHAYGPDSQEVLDCTLRSDAQLADFLSFLDEKVGTGQYAVAVTADHGICPLPELSAAIGRDAKRVPAVSLLLGGERHLQARFGKLDGDFESAEASKRTTWVETISAPWLYVNERLCVAKGVKKEAVAAEYVAWLRQQPDVMNAYTAEALTNPAGLDEAGKLMAKSFAPGRSGDVGVVLKPYYLIDAKAASAGTNHGTPHEYDRHVPLLVAGPGLKAGPTDESVTPQHSAAILSYFLGIATPKDCEYALPKTLLKSSLGP
jgi:hypothetical protein